MIKVLITGYRETNNPIYIKDFIFNIKQSYKDDNITIFGRGEYNNDNYKSNIDFLIRKYCREFDVSFCEYTPYYKQRNPFTINIYDIYTQTVKKRFIRLIHMFEHVNYIVYFIDKTLYPTVDDIKDTSFFNELKKHKTQFKIKII